MRAAKGGEDDHKQVGDGGPCGQDDRWLLRLRSKRGRTNDSEAHQSKRGSPVRWDQTRRENAGGGGGFAGEMGPNM